MYRQIMLFALLLIAGNSNLALAQYQPADSRWDRGTAMAAVRSVDIEVASNEIADLKALKAIEKHDDWPMPAITLFNPEQKLGLVTGEDGHGRDFFDPKVCQVSIGEEQR